MWWASPGRHGFDRSKDFSTVHQTSDELGAVVNPTTFTRTTKKLAVEAGVPPLTPHPAARHTWATLALSQGVNAKVVQERLGHSSIAITLDRYSHLIEGMDREAAEQVAALIQ